MIVHVAETVGKLVDPCLVLRQRINTLVIWVPEGGEAVAAAVCAT